MAREIKLLIVDDEPSLCLSLKMILDQKGYQTFTVGSFDKALDLARKNKFDLVIVDLVLKGNKKGIEIVKEIKNIQPEIKAFAWTGYGPEEVEGFFHDAA